MTDFYIVANSFAAPWFSDTDTAWVTAVSPAAALRKFARSYTHPAGLYCANCYRDANAASKGEKPLAVWHSNHLAALLRVAPDGGYSYFGRGPGDFDLNGKAMRVRNPKAGRVAAVPRAAPPHEEPPND